MFCAFVLENGLERSISTFRIYVEHVGFDLFHNGSQFTIMVTNFL